MILRPLGTELLFYVFLKSNYFLPICLCFSDLPTEWAATAHTFTALGYGWTRKVRSRI